MLQQDYNRSRGTNPRAVFTGPNGAGQEPGICVTHSQLPFILSDTKVNIFVLLKGRLGRPKQDSKGYASQGR